MVIEYSFIASISKADRFQLHSLSVKLFLLLSLNHFSIALTVCLGLLFCWKVNLYPSLKFLTNWSRLSTLTSFPVTVEKHPHMMLSSPCFTVWIVFSRYWEWVGVCVCVSSVMAFILLCRGEWLGCGCPVNSFPIWAVNLFSIFRVCLLFWLTLSLLLPLVVESFL